MPSPRSGVGMFWLLRSKHAYSTDAAKACHPSRNLPGGSSSAVFILSGLSYTLRMTTIVRAHFDGKHSLVLEEPVDLPTDRPLTLNVTYPETFQEVVGRIAVDPEFELCNIDMDEFLEDVDAARAAKGRSVDDAPTDGLRWPFLRAVAD